VWSSVGVSSVGVSSGCGQSGCVSSECGYGTGRHSEKAETLIIVSWVGVAMVPEDTQKRLRLSNYSFVFWHNYM
jgi:hypothetical protein